MKLDKKERIDNKPSANIDEGGLLYAERSDEVQEIMGRMPSWPIRWGITVICGLIAILFVGAYFIHYPDVITAKVIITSSNPPLKLSYPTNARIQRMFAKQDDHVLSEQVLAVMENPSDYEQVLLAKHIIQVLDTCVNLKNALLDIEIANVYNLGDLQPEFTDLLVAIYNYKYFYKNDFSVAKVRYLGSQIAQYDLLQDELKRKQEKLSEQFEIERKTFKVDSILAAEKAISEMEFLRSKNHFIDQQVNFGNNRDNMIHNQLQQSEFKKNITETLQDKNKQEYELEQKIREIVKKLVAHIMMWEQKNLIITPVEGKVNFFKVWKENQFVSAGEGIAMIAPLNGDITCKGMISENGAGKIKQGQKIIIKVAAYPEQEFGVLHGTIMGFSSAVMDSLLSVDIHLSSGLTTNAHKEIPAQQQLKATGEILTDEKTIMNRLFDKLKVNN